MKKLNVSAIDEKLPDRQIFRRGVAERTKVSGVIYTAQSDSNNN